ncbi:SipW-dependent-type signal peptide-containing protein [Natronomonas marina]|uniref:SipW-dependent-type signal peptide-containing protein n=1 Tax=Natronomonas marina TaxID=2961939 RepID=UPI0020C986C2|nr:SipW-dependent-type signal peptide-containing protein [Natronomonas marina]
MTRDTIDLSRRKILGGVGAIGVAGAGAGLGTSALFSDTEEFENNSVQAGTLDLVVDYVTTVTQDGVSPGSTTNDGTIQGGESGEYQIADAKPGDSGFLAFCPKIVDNPGWLFVGSAEGVTDYENGQTEPEGDVDPSGSGSLNNNTNDGSDAGELSEAIQVDVEYCEPNTSDPSGLEDYDTIREFNNPDDYTLADLFKELESGILLDGDADPANGTTEYPSSPNQSTQSGPCLCISWNIPTEVGNEIQSDAVEFDITFAARQWRNNPNPENPIATTTVWPGDDLANVVSNAGQDEIISVFGGSFGDGSDYDGNFNIDASGVTLARASAERPVINGQNGFAVGVDAADVTVDGFEIRNPGTQGTANPGSPGGIGGVDIKSGNTNVCIQNNIITNIGTGDDDANPIGVLASDGTSGIRVYNNEISNLEGTDEDQGQVQGVLINESGAQITDAEVSNNTITGLLDTRSTNAIRFNGDVTGEISDNDISDLNTEGTIPGSGGAPGGFTQVIALQQGGGSTTGPSNVTIRGNAISNIETTTTDNFAPPFHVILGGSTDGTTVSIDSNDFSGDSTDDEVYVGDDTGDLDLNAVLANNSYTPAGAISGGAIVRQ